MAYHYTTEVLVQGVAHVDVCTTTTTTMLHVYQGLIELCKQQEGMQMVIVRT